jgi:NAD(P)-dependent dehydrogenase (short-subunit alcohol dehydrogenase family)
MLQRILPLIPDGGAIILNASVGASLGSPTASIYNAAKAAVRSFGRTVASAAASRRIRVNTISPGPVDTPIFAKLGLPPESVISLKQQMAAAMALKRLGTPNEIAKVALFLASEDASFMIGSEVLVDGGIRENVLIVAVPAVAEIEVFNLANSRRLTPMSRPSLKRIP